MRVEAIIEIEPNTYDFSRAGIEARGYATIIQRARGIYLANCSDYTTGSEEYDAFSTLDAAKRWCRDYFDVRIKFRRTDQEGHWPVWHAEVSFDD